MKGKGGEEGMKTGAGRVTKLFNYVPFFVLLCVLVAALLMHGGSWGQGTKPAEEKQDRALATGHGPSVTSTGVESTSGTAVVEPRMRRTMTRRERVRRGVDEQLGRFKEIAAKRRRGGRINEVVESLAREDAEWAEVPRLRPVLREVLKNSTGWVKLGAASSLGMVGEEEDIPALEPLLRMPDEGRLPDGDFRSYQGWASGAIKRIRRRAQLRQELAGKPVGEQVRILVGTFRGSGRAPAGDPYVCARLIRIGPPAVPALVELLEEALSGHFPADRIPAMWWIPSVMGEIGDQRAAPILGKLAAYLRRSDGPDSNWTRRVEAVIDEMEGRQEGGRDK